MNENLNLVDMLKYCPKGTKLYSVVHGEVKLEAIVENDDYPIKYFITLGEKIRKNEKKIEKNANFSKK